MLFSKKILFLMLLNCFVMMEMQAILIDTNQDVKNLYSAMSESLDTDDLIYDHRIKDISEDGSIVLLDDGFSFTIDWWYKSSVKKWKVGDLVYIKFDFNNSGFKLTHVLLNQTVNTKIKTLSHLNLKIKSVHNGQDKEQDNLKIILSNGDIFRHTTESSFNSFKVNHPVLIFKTSKDTYQIWNKQNNKLSAAHFVGKEQEKTKKELAIKDILGLKNRLNDMVLDQAEAVHSLFTSLLNYSAGLKEKNRPIGVFLFIGPTGVGKTELAKALTQDIYNDSSQLLRFDMSHFTEPHSIARLIGSPPGYVNHEEGGQLTTPLNENSQRVVLLDEMEKAHPRVIKAFLPIFDEGFILDSKNNHVSCTDTIFIMTSNLAGPEIAQLKNEGLSSEDILTLIEPILMESLSPELYNRVEPVLFNPIKPETMYSLVELMLAKVTERVMNEKNIRILIDPSLKSFLAEAGYHPLLGARPLKKLIEKKVLAALAYEIITKEVSPETFLLLSYDVLMESVYITHVSSEVSTETEEEQDLITSPAHTESDNN